MSTTMITLPADHNYLASLPDGTRDELVLRSDGVAVLTDRVGKSVYTGGANESWDYSVTSPRYSIPLPESVSSIDASANNVNASSSSRFKLLNSGQTSVGITGYTVSGNRLYIYFDGRSLEDWKAWLSSNPVTVYYKLETPATSYSADNGATWSTTDPAAGTSAIPLQKGTNNVWCTDRLSPEVALEYVQDTNAVIKKLSAAIVAAGSIGV